VYRYPLGLEPVHIVGGTVTVGSKTIDQVYVDFSDNYKVYVNFDTAMWA